MATDPRLIVLDNGTAVLARRDCPREYWLPLADIPVRGETMRMVESRVDSNGMPITEPGFYWARELPATAEENAYGKRPFVVELDEHGIWHSRHKDFLVRDGNPIYPSAPR
jgi:hypothetical protein